MNAEDVLEISRSYQAACVLAAAADLDLVRHLRDGPRSAEDVRRLLDADLRGTRILLDALVALGLLRKAEGQYSLPEGVDELLGGHEPGSVLAMVQHQANCMRRWVQLARVVKTGRPADRAPSIRGEEGDAEAFIGAMDNVSAPVADAVVGDLAQVRYRHVLDVGGASGTWTIAFLRRDPDARATIFDLPHVMPMARRRLSEAGLLDRVDLAAGDFAVDSLPAGADLAWVSAIVHMSSRTENRALFQKVREALAAGGVIAIRDIIMEPSRVAPPSGALFAVNMLVGTEGGGTFTLDELRDDLEAAGFLNVRLARRDPGMSSVILADSPSGP